MSELSGGVMLTENALRCVARSIEMFYKKKAQNRDWCITTVRNAADQFEKMREEISTLRAQPANEPLTLEDGFDITNADGTPVDYDALGRKYKDQLCYCDIDEFYIGEDGQLVLMDDCGASVSVDRGDYCIRAHKPGGEQDA